MIKGDVQSVYKTSIQFAEFSNSFYHSQHVRVSINYVEKQRGSCMSISLEFSMYNLKSIIPAIWSIVLWFPGLLTSSGYSGIPFDLGFEFLFSSLTGFSAVQKLDLAFIQHHQNNCLCLLILKSCWLCAFLFILSQGVICLIHSWPHISFLSLLHICPCCFHWMSFHDLGWKLPGSQNTADKSLLKTYSVIITINHKPYDICKLRSYRTPVF